MQFAATPGFGTQAQLHLAIALGVEELQRPVEVGHADVRIAQECRGRPGDEPTFDLDRRIVLLFRDLQ